MERKLWRGNTNLKFNGFRQYVNFVHLQIKLVNKYMSKYQKFHSINLNLLILVSKRSGSLNPLLLTIKSLRSGFRLLIVFQKQFCRLTETTRFVITFISKFLASLRGYGYYNSRNSRQQNNLETRLLKAIIDDRQISKA